MSLFRDGLTALRRAGWAPIAVLVFHQICTKAGWRSHTDHLLHFLGGVAIAYFLFHALDTFVEVLGRLSRFGRIIFTFCAASTIALFWDLAEFASDEIFDTGIQHSLRETMLDLSFGVGGAFSVCLVIALVGIVRR